MSKLTDHNHVCDEARVVKWLVQAEMEDEMLKDILQRASHVRKKVICAFQQKYQNKPEVWKQTESLLAEDHHIDRSLNDLRLKVLGVLPRYFTSSLIFFAHSQFHPFYSLGREMPSRWTSY